MTTLIRSLATFAGVLALCGVAVSAQHPSMPAGMTHEEHLAKMKKDAELKKRGAAAMGFDQDKTAHQFVITDEGGRIEVTVNDPSDAASLAQVRSHLQDIAKAFAAGNFEKPLATHGEMPPGVRGMRQQRTSIKYAYEELPAGGRVVIQTSNAKAKSAIHEFLRYQIREHGTPGSRQWAGGSGQAAVGSKQSAGAEDAEIAEILVGRVFRPGMR